MQTGQQFSPRITGTSEHQANVTKAAMLYIESELMTLDKLAKTFHVSGNTINNWLCEAIAKNYISSTFMCKQLISKHILEYETKHNIKNSSLRQMYASAIEARNIDISVGA